MILALRTVCCSQRFSANKIYLKKVLKSAHGSVIIGGDRVGFSSLSAAKMGSCLADEGCIAAVENLHPLNHIREKNIQASLCSKCLL